MKTVTGKVVTTKPISLSKAAKVLSSFVAASTGASLPVSAYLHRTSAAFDELVHFHKDLRTSKKVTLVEDSADIERSEKHKKKRKERENEERESSEQSSLKKNKKKRRRNEEEQ